MRRSLRRPAIGLAADRGYLVVTALAAAFGLAVIGYLVWRTVSETGDVWSTFGVWGFLTGTEWVPNPPSGLASFGAAPFIYGTLVTSVIAMVVAVPLAIGVALATTVFLPKRLRGPFASVVDLLAAVFGFLIEKSENWSLLWWLPLQRFGYRQIMYYVVVRSILTAIRGPSVGWGKLERTGTVKVRHREELPHEA